jgi:hypothetical protein
MIKYAQPGAHIRQHTVIPGIYIQQGWLRKRMAALTIFFRELLSRFYGSCGYFLVGLISVVRITGINTTYKNNDNEIAQD